MTVFVGTDTAKTRRNLEVGGTRYAYYSIAAAEEAGLGDFSRLPAALKVVLENMLRFEDGKTVTQDDIRAFSDWADKAGKNPIEIAYRPARVLMQDFTGVPAVVDLAAMRDAMVALGGDPQKINPLNPVDLVIDHSVMVDEFGNARAFQMNVEREYQRNGERYEFLKWGQGAFDELPRGAAGHRHLPPGEPRVSRPVGLERHRSLRRARRLSRHAGRHRQPHHDGQRPRDPRLGRRRHRGRGGDARPADLDADPRGRGLQADRERSRRASPPPTWC